MQSLARRSLQFQFQSLRTYMSASATDVPLLISPSQLHKLVQEKNDVAVLDATWFMPNSPRKPYEEFLEKRIPGAQFLDLDEVASSHELGLKHMMPSGRAFADACEKWGVSPTSHVVIYDTHGVFSSPRALFMFRSFGHINSSVLNGGLPGWQTEAFSIDSGSPAQPHRTVYPTSAIDGQPIRSYEEIVHNSSLNPSKSLEAELVLDARPNGRYLGTDPEPRAGLSSGHIPNSFSLPFNLFLETVQGPQNSTYTTVRTPSEIRKALVDAVGEVHTRRLIQGDATAVTSCGSGMTAGILWLGLKLLGAPKIALYDESWTGYAMRPTSQIDKTAV